MDQSYEYDDKTGETIGKILTPEGIKGSKWPSVTYGEIPSGFSQTAPDHGRPPTLVANRLHAARIVEDQDAKTTLFFEIRNGKPSLIRCNDEFPAIQVALPIALLAQLRE